MEVVKDRICTDFKVDATLGKLQISYREIPHKEASVCHDVDIAVGDRRHVVKCSLKVIPLENPSSSPIVTVMDHLQAVVPPNSEIHSAIVSGIISACSRGECIHVCM